MNIKSLLGLKATTTVSPDHTAMAERVSTLKGCEALVARLEAAKSAVPSGRVHRHIGRQLDEARRLLRSHAIEADRARMTGAHKRDTEAARAALSGVEKALQQAEAAALGVTQARRTMEARIAPLTVQLAAERSAADARVESAREAFAKVMSSPADEAAEAASAKALRDAQTERKDAGATLTLRLDSLTAELQRLKQEEGVATTARDAAVRAVAEARAEAARVAFDIAAQGALDAHLNCIDAWASATATRPAKPFELTFYSSDRALWGAQLCGDTGGVREWAVAELAKALRDPDLALLCAPAPEADAEEPVVLPDPADFIPGSVDYVNAMALRERHAATA